MTGNCSIMKYKVTTQFLSSFSEENIIPSAKINSSVSKTQISEITTSMNNKT